MNLFIHIGYHKTATSYLQELIFPKLSHVNYIQFKNNIEIFSKIFYQDPLSFDINSARSDLEKCMDGTKINLISNENMSGNLRLKYNNKNIADKLYDLFPRAKIIIAIRNQFDFIISSYKQHISAGGTMSFKNRIGYNKGKIQPSYVLYDHRVNLEMFKFNNLINYYAEKFGKENILILLFEEFCQDKHRYLQKIFNFIGIKPGYDFDDINSVINRSYGANQIFIARILNRFIASQYNRNWIIPPIYIPYFGRLTALEMRKIFKSKLSFWLLGDKDIKISEDIKHQIKSYYNECNRALNKAYKLNLPDCYFQEPNN
ncbi:MAG: sulfotransferase [Cytophagales bacterium]|nr:sulfotransferase [Cytophagales bacterium]